MATPSAFIFFIALKCSFADISPLTTPTYSTGKKARFPPGLKLLPLLGMSRLVLVSRFAKSS
jgi:hypothetical protein